MDLAAASDCVPAPWQTCAPENQRRITYGQTSVTTVRVPAIQAGAPGAKCPPCLVTAAKTPSEMPCGHLAVDQDSVSTFAALFRRYGESKSLLRGRGLHDHVIQLGYDHNTFLSNCIIQMYGHCRCVEDAQSVFDNLTIPNTYSWNILTNIYLQNGRVHDARDLFGRMPCRDVVSWNTMISICAQNSLENEALEIFWSMHLEDAEPDCVTYICVLDACGNIKALDEGKEVHSAILSSGFELDIAISNTLIDMYGKCNSLDDAKNIFVGMAERSIVSWNAMLTAYVDSQHESEALELFYCMKSEKIEGDRVTYLSVLDACANLGILEEGHKVHAAIVDSSHRLEQTVSNSLIHMYGKCRSLLNCRIVFGGMLQRDAISWSAMISACNRNGHSREGLEIFRMMQCEGVYPDKITFIAVLDACTTLSVLMEAYQIHSIITTYGHDQDMIVGNMLVNIYGKCGSMEMAKNVFHGMPQHDVVSWSALIAATVSNQQLEEALTLYHEMLSVGVKPDKVALACVLDVCGRLSALEEGQKIHAVAISSGFDHATVLGTALIYMYGKCGFLDCARTVFSRMPCQDLVSWSAIIAATAVNGQGRESLSLFHQMQLQGIQPDQITFISILTACSHIGTVNTAWFYFTLMKTKYHLAPTADHYICMVDLLCRSGQLIEAEKLIKDMPSGKAAMAWLILANACKLHGDVERGERAANLCLDLDPNATSAYIMASGFCAAAKDVSDTAAKMRKEACNA